MKILRLIHLKFKIQEIFPERVANQVNIQVQMHKYDYMICKSRGKYFSYFKLKIHLLARLDEVQEELLYYPRRRCTCQWRRRR